jgi:hypothetical protein
MSATTPLLPGGLPLFTVLLVWGTCLGLGFLLGLYDRRLRPLGPQLLVYLVVIVSFTAFLHVMLEGFSRPLPLGITLLYAGGSLLTGLVFGGVGLRLARFF